MLHCSVDSVCSVFYPGLDLRVITSLRVVKQNLDLINKMYELQVEKAS